MLRNYKIEEKLKEIGVKDTQSFMNYLMREDINVEDYSFKISFNFITGLVLGVLITLMFIYVL
jgi:F0F1-type ATP synthase assembly protein I